MLILIVKDVENEPKFQLNCNNTKSIRPIIEYHRHYKAH